MRLAERVQLRVGPHRPLERLALRVRLGGRRAVHRLRRHAHTLAHTAATLQRVHHHLREAEQVARVGLQQRRQRAAQTAVGLQDQQHQPEVVHAQAVHQVERVRLRHGGIGEVHHRVVSLFPSICVSNSAIDSIVGGKEEELDAAVAHGAGDLAEDGVHHEEDAEVGVRADHALAAVHQPALVHQEEAVVLQQAVQAVQHRGVAEVRVVEHHPVAPHDRLDQRPVDPLERHVRRHAADRLHRVHDALRLRQQRRHLRISTPSVVSTASVGSASGRLHEGKVLQAALQHRADLHATLLLAPAARQPQHLLVQVVRQHVRPRRHLLRRRRLRHLGPFTHTLIQSSFARTLAVAAQLHGLGALGYAGHLSHAVHAHALRGEVAQRRLVTAAHQHAPQQPLQHATQLLQQPRVVPRRLHLLEAAQNLRGVRRRVQTVLVQPYVQQTRQRVQRRALARAALAHQQARQLVLHGEQQRLQILQRPAEQRLSQRAARHVVAMAQRAADLQRGAVDGHAREQRGREGGVEHTLVQRQHLGAHSGVAHALQEEHVEEGGGLQLVHRLVGQHQVAPAEHVAQVELEAVQVLRAPAVHQRVQLHHEPHHALQHAAHALPLHGGTLLAEVAGELAAHQLLGDQHHVLLLQRLHVHAREAVYERPRQPLAPAALLQRVLAGEDLEGRRTLEFLVDLGDVHRRAVVQAAVQALQHLLRRQVQLVQQDPRALLDPAQQHAVAPLELHRVALLVRRLLARRHGQVRAQQVRHVRLL